MAFADIIQKNVTDVFLHIKKHDPESHQKLVADSSKKEELTKKIRQIAEDEISQGEELKRNGNDVTKLVLPEGRLESIQNGLKMATYEFQIKEHPNRVAHLKFAQSGAHFKTINLDSIENCNSAYNLQLASIVIETVLLCMQALDIYVDADEEVIENAAERIVADIQNNPAFQRAVVKFVEKWNEAANALEKATALFGLLKETYAVGILWTCIKALCSKMTWWQWVISGAEIVAMVVASIATDGVALIAKLALSVKSAYDFVQKIANLGQLMQPSMK